MTAAEFKKEMVALSCAELDALLPPPRPRLQRRFVRRKQEPKQTKLPKIQAMPPELVEQAFPGGFTVRDEANALTAFAFRNGHLENFHAGKPSPLTSDPSLSRITDDEMKQLMIEASEKLERILKLRDTDLNSYRNFVQCYALTYCRSWIR